MGPVRRTGTGMALLVACCGVAGCFGGREDPRGAAGGARPAALARIVVDNRTDLRLDIAFRYAVEPGGDIGVGAVAPGARMEMAPIPAGEPILLSARAPGFERRLAPRSFEIDEVWTWVIDERSDDG